MFSNTRPACDVKPRGHCHAPPKLALFVDDRPEMTINPHQTGKTIRELFGFKDEVSLFRDYESPHDEAIGLEEAAPFDKGPVFYTRRQHTKLEIIVNNKRFTEAEGVKHHMTGLQIAALVSENAAATRKCSNCRRRASLNLFRWTRKSALRTATSFVWFGIMLPAASSNRPALNASWKNSSKAVMRGPISSSNRFPAVIYRDVQTRTGYGHLQMTDVLVTVRGGIRASPLTALICRKARRFWVASQVRHKASLWRTGDVGNW